MEAKWYGADEPKGELPDFKTIELTALADELAAANADKKFVFIADMSG